MLTGSGGWKGYSVFPEKLSVYAYPLKHPLKHPPKHPTVGTQQNQQQETQLQEGVRISDKD